MKFVKVALSFVLAFAVLFSFTGCAAAEAIYDDEEAIASIFDTCIATRYVENYQKIGNQITINSHAEYFSGSQKLCDMDFTHDTVFNVELTVIQGKFKIVLISEDKTIYILYENGSELLVDLSQLPEGDYVLKLVGQHAVFDLDMTVNLD